jgi:imidazolonepropionase-like amidohydrolase
MRVNPWAMEERPGMAGITAFVGGRLIDGRGGDPIDDAAILVEDGRITAVGRGEAIRLRGEVQRVDLGGLTVLPGLIDSHVHLVSEIRPTQVEHSERLSERMYRGIPFARRTLEAGVTTARDAGMTPAGMRIAIDEGIFPGPRLLVSVNIVSQTGGHGDWTLASGLDPGWITSDLPAGIADSPDEMRKVVRTMIRAGADWIKLCTTGGVLSPLDPPDTPQFTVEEIGVAVAEARAARLGGVMAHAIGAEGIRNALNAGVRSIEHGYMIDDEGIALLKETGAFLVPTLHALRSVRERADANPGSMPAWAMAKLDTVAIAQRSSLPEAIRAGVKVAMGTDCGVGYHGTNAREIGLLVEAGMTAMQAIEASTRVAAELMRRSDDLGTVEAGKIADLIAVDHDPLGDPDRIGDPGTVRVVVKDGVVAKDTDGRTSAPV